MIESPAINTPGSTPSSASSPGGGMAFLFAAQALSGAYATYEQGRAQKAISKVNKRIAEMQARMALERGQQLESLSRQRGKKTIGAQRAAMAAQGIRVDYGSAMDVQQETQSISELDALTIKNNALREAFGYQTEAASASLQGRLSTYGSNASAADTLLAGGINAYNAYKYGGG